METDISNLESRKPGETAQKARNPGLTGTSAFLRDPSWLPGFQIKKSSCFPAFPSNLEGYSSRNIT